MENMNSDVPLDYAVFQLSPKRTRCELFVSSGGSTEKLASGLVKPFITHLKIAEEQVASAAESFKLEVGQHKNAEVWFTKGTLERFVRFVSTPEVLELVNSSDAEMSQLEAARKIYSEGAGDQHSGESGPGAMAADDATKKELLRAIDGRLMAVQQDLSNACARAAAAGFNVDTVSELQVFADMFGAHRLNEACGKFILLCNRRPNLSNRWRSGPIHRTVHSSCRSGISLDDDLSSPTPREEAFSYQQPNPTFKTFTLHHSLSTEPSVKRDDASKLNDAAGEKYVNSTPEQALSIQESQPGRRLSVQDRINMFENKQKESSGGKPNVGKSVELRRLPSDASSAGAAADKAVLRRWSGVSDMSIDLTSEKDNESSPFPPSSPIVSVETKVSKEDGAGKSSTVVNPDVKVVPSLSRDSGSRLKDSSSKSKQFLWDNEIVRGESDGLKDQFFGKTQSMSSVKLADKQENWEEKSENVLNNETESSVVFENQGKLKDQLCGEDLNWPPSRITGVDDKASGLQNRHIGSTVGEQLYTSNQSESSELWNKPVTQTSLKSVRKNVGDGSKIREAFTSSYKGNGGDSTYVQQDKRSVDETVVEKKDSYAPDVLSSGSVSVVEVSELHRMQFGEQSLKADQSKKAKMKRDKSSSSGISITHFSGKVTKEALESFDPFSTPPPDHYQRVRQSKGNQELNDELKIKANELEKLFAQHKLRVPGDQSNSSQKGTSGDAQVPTSSLLSSNPVEVPPLLTDKRKANEFIGSLKNRTKIMTTTKTKANNSASLLTAVDSLNYVDSLEKNFAELSISESSRGKLYNEYVKQRDTKLMEDWSSNRAEKEARLKSMRDMLERNRSEMKTKLLQSADRQGSGTGAHHRAERLRSYNSRPIMKREQRSLDFEDSEDDVENSDILEKNCTPEDRTLDKLSSGDGVFRGFQGKKILLNNRHFPSSTPRASATAIPRSGNKVSFNAGKGRMQPENPLTQSVPNLSDLRKENTKSSGGSKTSRSQARSYTRSRNTNEEAATAKEDKRRRFQGTRRSSATPHEIREMSPQDSDVDFTQIKSDEDVQRSIGAKPFLKKGSRAGFVSHTSIPRLRAPLGTDHANNVDEGDDVASEPDESTSTAKDEGERDFEASNSEEHKNLEDEEPIPKLETEKFVNSGSENGDENLTFSRVGRVLGSHLPGEIPSSFLTNDVQDWPGESPMSWNSRRQHLFSTPNVMSDVDASADSPGGSPPSWNSNSLNQMDTDAARMRKKWGMAHKPTLVAHSSNSSRKDMTRGFKRLLKFGRKSRGSEGLVDWISATTSEGDDDTEDGRDSANRSSEDLRKSRMGFSQAHPSDYNFNENEVFSESVQSLDSSIPAPPSNFKLREDHISGSSIKGPRSFFSLSTFRSKGNESKLR